MRKRTKTKQETIMTIQPTNKAMKILALIKEGGATAESLMAACELQKTGLASQLSYLNTRGLNIAEVDPAKAEFPMKGADGVFFLGTIEQYQAKRVAKPTAPKKTLSPEQVLEAAQKREDKASGAYAKAKARLDAYPDNSILALRALIAEKQLELASALLHLAETGDTSEED